MGPSPAPLRSPTARLMVGLAFTLAVIGANAAYTLRSVQRMRGVQSGIVERNRLASLQLIRIQGDLNSLALAMRDMLDQRDGYPLTAWKPSFDRIRGNLDDAIRREAQLTADRRAPERTAYLRTTFDDFWRTADSMFASPDPLLAIRTTLQPRQEALTALTARLLVETNERESLAADEIAAIFSAIERNAYLLLAASVVLIAVTSLSLIRSNRTLFARLADLAAERQGLARQLITTQESTLRSISRDLHDEFGQILTAIGALLRRAGRLAPSSEFTREIQQISTIVQSTLEKIRSLSQSLQPVILEEQGLLPAIVWHLQTVESHTGLRIESSLPSTAIEMPSDKAIHVFRILQEALNNVVRHSGVTSAAVTLRVGAGALDLTVDDAGRGIAPGSRSGVGLSAMQERAALVHGTLTIGRSPLGGARISLSLPVPTPEFREVNT